MSIGSAAARTKSVPRSRGICRTLVVLLAMLVGVATLGCSGSARVCCRPDFQHFRVPVARLGSLPGALLCEIPMPAGVTSQAVSADGKTIALASASRQVSIVQGSQIRQVALEDSVAFGSTVIGFDPSGQYLALILAKGTLQLLNISDLDVKEISLPISAPTSVAAIGAEADIACLDASGSICIVNCTLGRVRKVSCQELIAGGSLLCSLRGQSSIAVICQSKICILELGLEGASVRNSIEVGENICSVSASTSQLELIIVTRNSNVFTWNWTSNATDLEPRIRLDAPIVSVLSNGFEHYVLCDDGTFIRYSLDWTELEHLLVPNTVTGRFSLLDIGGFLFSGSGNCALLAKSAVGLREIPLGTARGFCVGAFYSHTSKKIVIAFQSGCMSIIDLHRKVPLPSELEPGWGPALSLHGSGSVPETIVLENDAGAIVRIRLAPTLHWDIFKNLEFGRLTLSAICENGLLLCCFSDLNRISIFRLNDTDILHVEDVEVRRPNWASSSPNCARLAVLTAGVGVSLIVMDCDPHVVRELGDTAEVTSLCWSADSESVYVGLSTGCVSQFSAQGQLLQKSHIGDSPIGCLALCPRRNFLAIADLGKVIHVLSANEPERGVALDSDGSPRALFWSEDGRMLLSVDNDGNLEGWTWDEAGPKLTTSR